MQQTNVQGSADRHWTVRKVGICTRQKNHVHTTHSVDKFFGQINTWAKLPTHSCEGSQIFQGTGWAWTFLGVPVLIVARQLSVDFSILKDSTLLQLKGGNQKENSKGAFDAITFAHYQAVVLKGRWTNGLWVL